MNREQWCNKLHQAIIHDDEDKYGRVLARLELVDDYKSINDILLEEGYIGAYDRGKKQPFTSYFEYMDLLTDNGQ